MHIHPTQEQQVAFGQMTEFSPICMINLLKFREGGKQVYLKYMKAVSPPL